MIDACLFHFVRCALCSNRGPFCRRGVQGFSFRVFAALAMPQNWQAWEPPGRESKRPRAAVSDTSHDDAGIGNQTRGRSPDSAHGGVEATSSNMPVEQSARAAASSDDSHSPTLPTQLVVGGCSRCSATMMTWDLRWDTHLCNRCHNLQQGHDKCRNCKGGLWAIERASGTFHCRNCHRYLCRICDFEIGPAELRQGRQLHDRCYNVWQYLTDRCKACQRGLLKPEQAANEGWCDPCWARYRTGADC